MTNSAQPASRPLRIAHISATFPPYQGGTGNVCYHHARQLAALEHKVHVFTAAVAGAPTREVDVGVVIHRLKPLLQIGNAPLLPQLLWQFGNFDILHLHYPFILGAEQICLAKQLYRLPLVLSFHNDLIGNGRRARLFAAYQHLSAHLTVRQANLLCAVSDDHFRHSRLGQSLAHHRPPIVELPNGVDVNHFYPEGDDIRAQFAVPPAAPLALFVAALDRAHHFKGLDRLLAALPPHVWLLVVGDGDMRHAYQQQARALPNAGRVIFADAIPQTKLPPYYRAADVTILPSTPPESFGLVLVESLACATPVIASNIPGVRTVVAPDRDGFLVKPDDMAALAAQLRRFFALPPARRREMGLAGRQKVEKHYDWRQIGRQLAALYRQLLSQPQDAGSPLQVET